LDVLKRLAEVIPFLEPYPTWTKVVVGAWIFFSAFLVLSLLFAPRRTLTIEPLRISGIVLSAGGAPIQAAAIEFAVGGRTSETITDSEGHFGIEATRPATTAGGRIRIAASGYRSYERVIEVRSDSKDLGSFTLQPDVAPRAGETGASQPFTRRPEDRVVDQPSATIPGQSSEPSAVRRPVLPGSYNLDFSELTGADRTPFEGSENSGFRITPLTRNWLVGRQYGHPAPYIFFVKRDDTDSRSSGVSIEAAGQIFVLESFEVYSSVSQIPYVITGYKEKRTVFKTADVVGNTFGNFARVDNGDNKTKSIDRVVIEIEGEIVTNPVGIDNIVIRVAANDVSSRPRAGN
jgi:hypothetical protein